jgi:3-oxoacyl-[acyl-carrier protein] reductase
MYRMHGATVVREPTMTAPDDRCSIHSDCLTFRQGVVSLRTAKHDGVIRGGGVMKANRAKSAIESQGRVALVTGAGSGEGIGFATARLLAETGIRVAMTSTTKRIFDRLRELPATGENKAAFVADLTDPKQAEDLVAAVKRRFGRLDILVNNAGMLQTGRANTASRVEKIDDAEWRLALALNLDTCFYVTRAAIAIMLRQRYGRIVNISSVSGPLVTFPKGGAYGAAKAAMTGYTRSLALELASKGITANAVLPGWIRTGSATAKEIRAGRATPTRRSGRPEEVGAVAAFLASEAASYVNGQMIVVDGGNIIQEMKGSE